MNVPTVFAGTGYISNFYSETTTFYDWVAYTYTTTYDDSYKSLKPFIGAAYYCHVPGRLKLFSDNRLNCHSTRHDDRSIDGGSSFQAWQKDPLSLDFTILGARF